MEDLPVPLSRVESYLAKACGMDVITPEPGPGIEPFLYAIAYNTTPPVAGYRTEEWLAYVQGVTPAKPLELEGSCIIGNQKVDVKYFAVAAGMPGVTLPEKPQNRKEEYWEYIATHRPTPGVLKYATGTNITLTDVVRGIKELQYVYGDTFQQTYSGKNLFDADYYENATYTTGTYKYVETNFEAGKTYSFSAQLKSGKTAISGLYVYISTAANPNSVPESQRMAAIYNGSTATRTSSIPSGETLYFQFYPTTTDITQLFDTYEFQLEYGSATSYEPYVGGIPAPNPDYPQAVQTVTGVQTVWVHGKNIFNPALLSQVEGYNTYDSATGLWTTTGLGGYYRSIFYDATSSGGNRDVSKIVGPLTANTAYTVKLYDFVNNTTATSKPLSYAFFHSDNTVIAGSSVKVESFFTFTTPDEACYLDIRRLESNGTFSFSKIMIIEGTYTEQTMPSYEAYQGSIFTVNLGSIELCKIGTYQDYIYKSGDDWYVHKEIQKILVDGVNIKVSSQHNTSGGINGFRINISSVGNLGYTDMLSNNFNYIDWGTYQSSDRQYGEVTATVTAPTTIYVTQPNSTTGTTFDSAGVTSMNTWFSNHNTLIYYVLATPTDTQITDATLVGQLSAIDSAILPKPIAYITVGATDPNLPGPLKISYYGEEE